MEIWNDIHFNIIDLCVISFIIISCIVASYRGFIKEVFSMICWIAALVTSFHFYEAIKIQLAGIVVNKTILETISFCLPFIITLFVSTLISKWLSPKFTMQGLLIFDKFGGFIFGILRGIFLIILLYLGFIYLLGKERNVPLPNIILEATSYDYIKNTSILLIKLLPVETKPIKKIDNNSLQDEMRSN
jgi:membrane protein required for colicin V production